MKLEFVCVLFGSDKHKATIKLRDKILRKPLKMKFTPEQLAAEKDDIHLATYLDGKLVACMVMQHYSQTRIKMRQVAVDTKYQKKGIGQQMVLVSESLAANSGRKIMFCHARAVAADFYEKLNYKKVGDAFKEVGLKHWKMEKKI